MLLAPCSLTLILAQVRVNQDGSKVRVCVKCGEEL